MSPEIFEYLNTQRVGVLALEMMDGSPHGATVHFAHTEDPFVFYFETDKKYRKSEALYGREKSRASFVVGVSEEDLKTMQLDGEVRLVRDDEKSNYEKVYFGKFPEKIGKFSGPDDVWFVFEPHWWRFTDFKAPGGKKVLVSPSSN